MIRALWTAGLGMMAQQFNVDVISNNLANVNTTGFKKERAEFKDLLYETVNKASIYEENGKPVNLQVGHGVVPVATTKMFFVGNMENTSNPTDFAIDGEGFFVIRGPGGRLAYTRDGSFKLSVSDEGPKLVTSDGYAVLDDAGNDIIIDINLSQLSVSESGEFMYTDEEGAIQSLGQRLGLVKFSNPAGLENIGRNLYVATSASGEAVEDSEIAPASVIRHMFLESSNVQVVEEMVKLIVAQRAYEINSKSVQSADEMLGIANNLRR